MSGGQQSDDLARKALEEAAKALGSEATKALIGQAVPGAGVAISKVFGWWFKGRSSKKADHPSLKDVREVLDRLERMIPTRKSDDREVAHELGNHAAFVRSDKTSSQVADIWFRRNTKKFKAGPGPLIDKWILQSGNKSDPYFTAQTKVNVDFDNPAIEKARRHPLLKQAHPFIMLSAIQTDREVDCIGAAMESFTEIWNAFLVDQVIHFERGIEMRLANQGYMEGNFRVIGYPFCDATGRLIENVEVTIKREMYLSLVGKTLWILNYGTPRYKGTSEIKGSSDMQPIFASWMSNFRIYKG